MSEPTTLATIRFPAAHVTRKDLTPVLEAVKNLCKTLSLPLDSERIELDLYDPLAAGRVLKKLTGTSPISPQYDSDYSSEDESGTVAELVEPYMNGKEIKSLSEDCKAEDTLTALQESHKLLDVIESDLLSDSSIGLSKPYESHKEYFGVYNVLHVKRTPEEIQDAQTHEDELGAMGLRVMLALVADLQKVKGLKYQRIWDDLATSFMRPPHPFEPHSALQPLMSYAYTSESPGGCSDHQKNFCVLIQLPGMNCTGHSSLDFGEMKAKSGFDFFTLLGTDVSGDAFADHEIRVTCAGDYKPMSAAELAINLEKWLDSLSDVDRMLVSFKMIM